MSERELERRAQRRLAVPLHVEEVGGNVAATCRYYGISRQCYYGWLRRYQADGLDRLKDRSSRPYHSPRLIQAEVIEKIVWLRKHYHFGPAKIARYLARYHDLTISSRTSHRWVDLAGWARACGADVHLVSGHMPQRSRGHLGPSGIHAHEQDLRRSSQGAAAGTASALSLSSTNRVVSDGRCCVSLAGRRIGGRPDR
jgi:transposase